jgi:hypothetical protein
MNKNYRIITVLLILSTFITLITVTSAATGYPLYAGQTILVGEVLVSDDGVNVYVEYDLDGPWVLTEVHCHVAASLAGIPQTGSGNPKVGHFDCKSEDPLPDEHVCTLPIPTGKGSGDWIAIAAHAVVENSCGQEETAWAFTCDQWSFPGRSWATYIMYQID